MTIQQFIKLSFEEKSEWICAEGKLIDDYETDNINVKVFAVDSFFVEVLADTREEKITDIIPYTRGFSFFSRRQALLEQKAAKLNSFFLL